MGLPFSVFVQPLDREDGYLRGVQSTFAPVAGAVPKEHVFTRKHHRRVAVMAVGIALERAGLAPAFAVVP